MSTRSRERTREMRAARAAELARERRRHRTFQVVGAVVIVGLLAGIAFAVARSVTSDTGVEATGKVVVPANVEAGAFPVGDAKSPVTLDLYYDYMCPACGAFEAANSKDLSRLIADGTLRVNLRVLSFLDRMSQGTEYSTRAANAYATVADRAPNKVWAFHTALYDNQPEEGTKGLSDDRIAEIATEAGVPAGVVDTFADGTHRGWVAQSTREASRAGVSSTPTVLINGKVFAGDWSRPGVLATAIEDAAAGSSR
ncbi:MAG: DsbA family protein [Nocardioides sp.]|nr:DsbA family protein [Nocardioides sp.]